MEVLRHVRGNRGFSLGLCVLTGLGALLGLALLFVPDPFPATSAAQATTCTPTRASVPLPQSLPRAWDSPTPIPSPSNTPTLTGTPSGMPSATPTAIPSPTLPATATPTAMPTATPTPVHAPADADPTHITIAAIGVDASVVTVGITEEVVDGVVEKVWEVADYAAGFHEGSARPGHVGNTVITGHNNVRGEVFRDLDQLEPGDQVIVWVGEAAYYYEVSALYRVPVRGAPAEVLSDNLRWISTTDDERVTLVTCWPYWSNTHRTIVVAFPVAAPEPTPAE